MFGLRFEEVLAQLPGQCCRSQQFLVQRPWKCPGPKQRASASLWCSSPGQTERCRFERQTSSNLWIDSWNQWNQWNPGQIPGTCVTYANDQTLASLLSSKSEAAVQMVKLKLNNDTKQISRKYLRRFLDEYLDHSNLDTCAMGKLDAPITVTFGRVAHAWYPRAFPLPDRTPQWLGEALAPAAHRAVRADQTDGTTTRTTRTTRTSVHLFTILIPFKIHQKKQKRHQKTHGLKEHMWIMWVTL